MSWRNKLEESAKKKPYLKLVHLVLAHHMHELMQEKTQLCPCQIIFDRDQENLWCTLCYEDSFLSALYKFVDFIPQLLIISMMKLLQEDRHYTDRYDIVSDHELSMLVISLAKASFEIIDQSKDPTSGFEI